MSDTIELRAVDRLPEPAFTELSNRVLHDPDREAIRRRFFGGASTPPTPTQAQQVRIGAFDGDTLVGWSHAFLLAGGVLYVASSGVDTAYRRRGLYTRLIAAMEEQARALGCTRVESHHRSANSTVIIAKLKAGYTIVGTEFSAEMGLLIKMCKLIDERRHELFEARAGHLEAAVRFLGKP